MVGFMLYNLVGTFGTNIQQPFQYKKRKIKDITNYFRAKTNLSFEP